MPKQMRRLSLFFVSLFIVFVLMTGCGPYINMSQKADDGISKAINKNIGKKVYYEGKSTSESGAIRYTYLLRDSQDKGLLSDLVDIVNEKLAEENTEEIIVLAIREKIPGGETPIATMCNYDENEVVASENQCLKYIIIYGNEIADYSSYNKASFYPTMEGIEYLEVIDIVNQSAEDEGIDWYEVFPDLKGYEVFVRREKDGTYNPHVIYQEMKEDEENKNSGKTEEESLLEP